MLRCRVLSGNALKLIAALAMLIDHIGVLLLPQVLILRVIGRISFPIFAFMIAEGCRYTKNKARYFFTMLGVGAACQVVMYLYNRSLEMSVLITFSLSVLLIYAFQWVKEEIFAEGAHVGRALCAVLLFAVMLVATGILGAYVDLDYGATGAMLPLFAALLHPPKRSRSTHLHKCDDPRLHALSMSLGMLLLALDSNPIQYWSFLCLPLLLLYSGRRGKWHLKYFFYVFYPTHLLLLQVIAWLV